MRALVFSLSGDWTGLARLLFALSRAGFEVGAICPQRSYLSRTVFVSQKWPLESGATSLASIVDLLGRVMQQWSPKLIVPGDDSAASVLRFIGAQESKVRAGEALLATVQASIGDPERYAQAERRSLLAPAAAAAAVAMPPQLAHPTPDQALEFARSEGFPVVVKSDFSMGGQGVRICHGEEQLRQALASIAPHENALGEAGVLSVQKYIEGTPAAVAACALNGEQLAGFAYEKYQTTFPTGPSTVIRRLDRGDMVEDAARLIRFLRYSGFAGVDFIIDKATGQAWMVEFNPRPTPAASRGHLMGVDLCAALIAGLRGERWRAAPVPQAEGLIAFFPEEWWRDPQSPFLHSAFHDVPWNDPPLLQYFVERRPAHLQR